MCPLRQMVKSSKNKRLFFVNLKELHTEFVKTTGNKIVFSKFCELCPKMACHCKQYRETDKFFQKYNVKHVLVDI